MDDKISPEMIGVLILEEIKGMRKDMKEELQSFKSEIKMELKSLRLQFYDHMRFSQSFSQPTESANQIFEESLIEEIVGLKKNESYSSESLSKEIASYDLEATTSDHNLNLNDSQNEINSNGIEMFEQKRPSPIDVVVVKVDGGSPGFKPERKSNRLHSKEYLSRLYKEYHLVDRKSGFKALMDPTVYAEKHCPHCKKYIPKKSALIRHVRTHTGEKPFKCETCDNCFTRKEHLKSHKLIHTGDKPYKCQHCPNMYRYQKSLKVHVTNAHKH